jgi:hypothetical protein
LRVGKNKYTPGAYSFFRSSVEPKWDDPKNVKGAEWSIRRFNNLQNMSEKWLNILMSIIGNYDTVTSHIMGARFVDSTLPNKPMYRIEIWFDDVNVTDDVKNFMYRFTDKYSTLLYRVHEYIREN